MNPEEEFAWHKEYLHISDMVEASMERLRPELDYEDLDKYSRSVYRSDKWNRSSWVPPLFSIYEEARDGDSWREHDLDFLNDLEFTAIIVAAENQSSRGDTRRWKNFERKEPYLSNAVCSSFWLSRPVIADESFRVSGNFILKDYFKPLFEVIENNVDNKMSHAISFIEQAMFASRQSIYVEKSPDDLLARWEAANCLIEKHADFSSARNAAYRILGFATKRAAADSIFYSLVSHGQGGGDHSIYQDLLDYSDGLLTGEDEWAYKYDPIVKAWLESERKTPVPEISPYIV